MDYFATADWPCPFACRAFQIIRSGFTDEKTDIEVKSLPWTHSGRPVFWNSNCQITKPRFFPGTLATRAMLGQHICLKHAYWIGFTRAEAEWHRATVIRALRQWVGEKNSCLPAQVCQDATPWLMWLDQSALRSSDFGKEMGSRPFVKWQYLLRNRIAGLRDQQAETELATDLERLTQLGLHICKYKINLVSEKHFPFIVTNKNEKKKHP